MSPNGAVVGLIHFCFLYADPGSGMLIWQLITAAALGVLFYARTIVRKIRGLIGTDEQNEDKSSSTQKTQN